jgi:hypothetical protein
VLTCLSVCVFHFDLVRHAEPVHVIVRIPSGDLTLTSFKVSSVVKNSRHSDTIHSDIFTAYYLSLEDRRPIGDLTSKPRPNSEPALFFFCVPTGHHRRGTRDLLTFAGTSHGDDEVYFFPSSRRAILGTLPAARRASPLPRPLRLSQHVTCHGGVSVTSLRHAGSAGLCPTTSSGWARRSPVALTFTRLTLPRACLRFGCSSSRFTVNKKVHCYCTLFRPHEGCQRSPTHRLPALHNASFCCRGNAG